LRLLRQLLLEDGFWIIKDTADALYRKQQGCKAQQRASLESEKDSLRPPCEAGGVDSEGRVEDTGDPGTLRLAGRGSRYVPSWLTTSTNEHDNVRVRRFLLIALHMVRAQV
jgi:hypothetical protein